MALLLDNIDFFTNISTASKLATHQHCCKLE